MSGLGDMGNLLKQAQEMQRQIDRVKNELRSRVVTGRAGGGLVRVEISADRLDVKGVEIAVEIHESHRPEELNELVVTALQDALRQARDIEKDSIGQVTGGMQLPGLF